MLSEQSYKNASTVESVFVNQNIGVKINISVNRELNVEEQWKIHSYAEKILSEIRRNSRLSDPKEMEEVANEKQKIIACFPQPIHVREIPHEYEGDTAISTWFLVTTTRGPIKIGWRKRVIDIDWSTSDIKSTAQQLFPGEDTTKGEFHIHAWGYDKAKEYITQLLNANS